MKGVGGDSGTGGVPAQPAAPWDEISTLTNEQLRERLYEIGPPWGNPKLLARDVEEGFWIAFEALDRLEAK